MCSRIQLPTWTNRPATAHLLVSYDSGRRHSDRNRELNVGCEGKFPTTAPETPGEMAFIQCFTENQRWAHRSPSWIQQLARNDIAHRPPNPQSKFIGRNTANLNTSIKASNGEDTPPPSTNQTPIRKYMDTENATGCSAAYFGLLKLDGRSRRRSSRAVGCSSARIARPVWAGWWVTSK